jgi:hypothetical protein
MADKYYVADTPLVRLDCVSNITGATDPRIYYKKPDGTSGFWVATIENDPVTGFGRYVIYQIPNGTVLDQSGDWKFQSHMTVGVWTGFGETVVQRVYEVFK